MDSTKNHAPDMQPALAGAAHYVARQSGGQNSLVHSPAKIDDSRQHNQQWRRRAGELPSANDSLRREVESETRKLDAIMHELVLAAERVGQQPLTRAMHAVARWQSELATMIVSEPVPALAGVPTTVPRLSARENEVLRRLTEGARSPRIATDLGICIATVEVHRRNIMRKLGLHCVADLTRYAVRQGLTSL